MKLHIGGYEPFTLTDFPGHVAAVVYTQGCNFRCPFCHNGLLLNSNDGGGAGLALNRVLRHLKSRAFQLDGVVLSGGEPTLQPDLDKFLALIKAMDLETKLDTNGSRPEIIRRLLAKGLLDTISMDVKAPLEKYSELAGVKVDIRAIAESIQVIAGSGIEHEFRTTFVEPLLNDADLDAIRRLIPPGSKHRVQPFVSELALDPKLRMPRERT